MEQTPDEKHSPRRFPSLRFAVVGSGNPLDIERLFEELERDSRFNIFYCKTALGRLRILPENLESPEPEG